MKRIDLHVHSVCSDGTLSPSKLVQHACDCGLSAFALTDHDNTDGIEEALLAAETMDLEIIPGIEFSTIYHQKDIHIVGLDIDWKHPDFQTAIETYRQERKNRNQKMIDKMASDGIDISYRKMAEMFDESVWTRAHFGRYLYLNGYVSSIREAFQTHIGDNCKYYVPREKVEPDEVICLIRKFGGIPILAHPFQYRMNDSELRILLDQLILTGLLGIEVYYSTHTEEQTAYLLQLAKDFFLTPSGGSDYHGANKPSIEIGIGQGNLNISYTVLEELRKVNRRI